MTAPKTIVKSETNDDHEGIVGQFIYAFGQGAGSIRVSRRALIALRSRYLGPIQAAAAEWEARAAYVLPLLSQVGRLAAFLATGAGRAAISEADFTEARRLVEARTHESTSIAGHWIAGPLCPTVEGEPKHQAPQSFGPSKDLPFGPVIPSDTEAFDLTVSPSETRPQTH